MRDASEIEDHKITIDGDDMDGGENEFALATFIEVAGAKMQTDFESVIERKIHAWFNYMEGVMHTGQRNQFRVRVSQRRLRQGAAPEALRRGPVPYDHGRIRRRRR